MRIDLDLAFAVASRAWSSRIDDSGVAGINLGINQTQTIARLAHLHRALHCVFELLLAHRDCRCELLRCQVLHYRRPSSPDINLQRPLLLFEPQPVAFLPLQRQWIASIQQLFQLTVVCLVYPPERFTDFPASLHLLRFEDDPLRVVEQSIDIRLTEDVHVIPELLFAPFTDVDTRTVRAVVACDVRHAIPEQPPLDHPLDPLPESIAGVRVNGWILPAHRISQPRDHRSDLGNRLIATEERDCPDLHLRLIEGIIFPAVRLPVSDDPVAFLIRRTMEVELGRRHDGLPFTRVRVCDGHPVLEALLKVDGWEVRFQRFLDLRVVTMPSLHYTP